MNEDQIKPQPETPFTRSRRTQRSPTRPTTENPTKPTIRTRSQNTEKIATPKTPPTTTPNSKTMDLKEIQQSISTFVPEFSGADTTNRPNELARFLGTADDIYQNLKSDEERQQFTRLIKFRLTGDAYIRISRREVTDYPALREILNNMYAKSLSLSELERGYSNIQQSYGETVRNYGYRIMEALEQYKNGYKNYYKLANLDNTYNQHLNTTAVQSFKRGLNNTILKEKIATYKAKDIDDIIEETETIEKMLTATSSTQETQIIAPNTTQQTPHTKLTNNNYKELPTTNIITCNYCQRPGHTWDICRTRINQERFKRMTPPYHNNTNNYRNQPQTHNARYQQPTQYPNANYQAPYKNFFQQNPQQNNINPAYQNKPPNTYPRYTNYPNQQNTSYRPNPQYNRPPTKYCSHCKTTTGHTFEECRSKFYNRNSPPNNPQARNPDTRQLEEKFNNMRINMIYPHATNIEPDDIQNQNDNQGNYHGSDRK